MPYQAEGESGVSAHRANSKLNAPLKSATSQRGYLSVVFSRQSKISSHFVHRVVATAFLGARGAGGGK